MLTKADKIKPAELDAVAAATEVKEPCPRRPAAFPRVAATSSAKGAGLPELRAEICAAGEIRLDPFPYWSGRAGRLQGRGPPQQIVDHGRGGRFQLGEARINIAALEVGPKGGDRYVHRGADRGDLQLDQDLAQPFDAAGFITEPWLTKAAALRFHSG